MLSLFFLAILAYSDNPTPDTYRVDMLEINTLHRKGSQDFQQVILWDWHERSQAYRVVHWQAYQGGLVRNVNGYYTYFWANESRPRIIQAKYFRRTTTAKDPERENQKVLPVRWRRKLWQRN